MPQQTRKAGQAGKDEYQMSAISELVFLDRYATKDPQKELKVGDVVVALVKDDPRFPQREVGTVRAVDGDTITVEVKSTGELIKQERKKVDRPLETHPSQMWDRMAEAIVEVEDQTKRKELAKEFRWALDNFRFSPGGRINTMLGTNQNLTAYNCLPPDQEVLTSRGYVPISDVEVGELVVTHKNRLRPVVAVWKRPADEPMYSVKARKVGYDTLRATGDHPVLVKRDRHSDAEWVQMRHLHVGDYVALAVDRETLTTLPAIRLSDYLSEERYYLTDDGRLDTRGKHSNLKGGPICNELVVDEDLLYLFGTWLGDGCVTHRTGTDIPSGIQVTFHQDERDRAETIQRILSEKFQRDPIWQENSSQSTINVVLCSMPVGEFFENCFGAYFNKRRIPAEFMSLPDHLVVALLRGLFQADGYIYRNTFGILLANRRLCVQAFLLLQRLGFLLSIFENTHVNNTVPAYRITGSLKSDSEIAGLLFDIEATATDRRLRYYLEEDDLHWVKVKEFGVAERSASYAMTPSYAAASVGASGNFHPSSVEGFTPTRKAPRPDDAPDDFHADGLTWARVETIDVVPYQGTVHDIQVAEDSSFVSAGIVIHNCYVIPMESNHPATPRDSRQAIIDTLGNMVEIMSRGGGVGINLSTLRPRLSYVKGVNGRSSGAVSWGGLFSFATGLVEQGGCFDGDQRIATTRGLIPAAELAERIESGEYVEALTHLGPRMITARFRNGKKPVFKVTTARGFTVNVTAEHKMGVLHDGKIATVPLEELSVGAEILTLLGSGVESDYVELRPAEYDRSIMSTTLNEDVRFPTALDERLAYLIGYMHGDGYVSFGKKVTWRQPKAVKMATADAYPEIRETLTSLCEDLFGLSAVIEDREEACASVSVYSRLLVEWLMQNDLLKEKSANVRVPEAVFRSPSSVVGAFIAGYFDADGSDRTRKCGYGIDSISLPMLQDVQQLLAAHGIASHINALERSKDGWRTIYRLCVTGAEFKERMSRFISWAHKDKHTLGSNYQGVWDSTKDRISYRALTRIGERLVADGNVALAESVDALLNVLPDTIESIEPLGIREVFDFEVMDVHMLSGNGIYTSNSRRGALMLILNDWHPDIMDFINAKRDMGAINNANISVGVSNDFMKAVEEDLEWQLVFPDTSDPEYDRLWDGNLKRWRDEHKKPVNVFKTVRAREMWDTIMESAWLSAEPGVVFLERMNEYSNSWYFEDLVSTNPCGEQPLPGWGVCNLGHINLSRFVKDGKVLWEDLRKAVRLGVRFLDNVIDVTPYFFDRNEKVQKDERRVGLGTLGLGEMLIGLGLRYGSDEAIEFIDKLYEFIATEAYLASTDLAKEKGAFPKFDAEKFLQSKFVQSMPEKVREKIAQDGIRNVCILTQAPTGSTGTMIGTSTGIEPYYSWTYWRKGRLGMKEVQEQIVQRWFDDHPDVEPLVENLPDYFVTAMDLSPKEHIKVQAAIQRWTDSSISKTANCPNNYTVEQTKELYEYAYRLGCKGVTVYRDGSRDEQVLSRKEDDNVNEESTVSETSANSAQNGAVNGSGSGAHAQSPAPSDIAKAAAALVSHEDAARERSTEAATIHVDKVTPTDAKWEHRPQKLTGATYEWPTPLGKAFITVNELDGRPVEVFVNIGKAGSDVAAASEALGRLTTLFLKHAAIPDMERKVSLLVDHLANIGGSTSVGFGENRVTSVPDAIAKTLRRHLSENGSGLKVKVKVRGMDLCPTCGTAALAREEGCYVCKACGYSKC